MKRACVLLLALVLLASVPAQAYAAIIVDPTLVDTYGEAYAFNHNAWKFHLKTYYKYVNSTQNQVVREGTTEYFVIDAYWYNGTITNVYCSVYNGASVVWSRSCATDHVVWKGSTHTHDWQGLALLIPRGKATGHGDITWRVTKADKYFSSPATTPLTSRTF